LNNDCVMSVSVSGTFALVLPTICLPVPQEDRQAINKIKVTVCLIQLRLFKMIILK
jgi:hypothetical protein